MVGVQEGYLNRDEGHVGEEAVCTGSKRVCYGKGLLGEALWMKQPVIC